jgi:FixJ family two-component response regulator
MGFILTSSPSGSRRSSTFEHRFGPIATSQLIPIVFVIDEDVSIRQALERLIGAFGWKVETFASAHDFLARSRPTSPCCLILDVSPPDISLLELSERSGMPIISLTGGSDIATTVKAMKAGAFEFCVKPLHDGILISAIREALEASRSALCQVGRTVSSSTLFATLSLQT